MLQTIFSILAIYSITFLIREASIFDKPRDYLLRSSPFFFKLLNCSFCVSTHSGWIAYFIFNPGSHTIGGFLLWTLAGGPIGLIMNGVVNRLYREEA
jgi:hypothetical protein